MPHTATQLKVSNKAGTLFSMLKSNGLLRDFHVFYIKHVFC